jgi:hypothetical protein
MRHEAHREEFREEVNKTLAFSKGTFALFLQWHIYLINYPQFFAAPHLPIASTGAHLPHLVTPECRGWGRPLVGVPFPSHFITTAQ